MTAEQATIEIDDRLYLARASSDPVISYVLAVDSDARDSDDQFHDVIKAMLGANYCGPVEDTLAHSVQSPYPIVVDIGSGSGRWIAEIAAEFPDAQCFGIDLVPDEREDLPNNARILAANFNSRWPFDDGSVDFVHMRQLQYATPASGYKNLLAEAARVLRPGGLLLAGDTSRTYVNNENANLDIAQYMPHSQRHRETMFQLIRDNGLNWCGDDISTMMNEIKSIEVLDRVVIAIPIGKYRQPHEDSRPLSNIASQMVNRMVDILSSLRPLYKLKGGSDDEWDDVIVDLERDITSWPDVTFSFYMVWAQKK